MVDTYGDPEAGPPRFHGYPRLDLLPVKAEAEKNTPQINIFGRTFSTILFVPDDKQCSRGGKNSL
jgi:hypothetical protein